ASERRSMRGSRGSLGAAPSKRTIWRSRWIGRAPARATSCASRAGTRQTNGGASLPRSAEATPGSAASSAATRKGNSPWLAAASPATRAPHCAVKSSERARSAGSSSAACNQSRSNGDSWAKDCPAARPASSPSFSGLYAYPGNAPILDDPNHPEPTLCDGGPLLSVTRSSRPAEVCLNERMDRWLPWALVLLAGVVRAFRLAQTAVMMTAGPTFLRLADDAANGDFTALMHHNFHPLYPLAIAAATPVLGSPERAAVAVSVAAGALAVGALYALVRRAFDAKAAAV